MVEQGAALPTEPIAPNPVAFADAFLFGPRYRELIDLAGGYQVETLAPLAPAAPPADAAPDAVVEGFEAQRSAARKIVMEGIESTAAHRLTQGIIPGKKFRKVHVSVLLARLETRRVALPAWVLAYSYRGKRYRAVVHISEALRRASEVVTPLTYVADSVYARSRRG